ncbi:hypothetical protein QBC38DRAFT_490148 [Podospora fimiseda]|uniref:Uncharacterized protein n=1 Tax=Podospora fimiseda TaxID=252190 RepID=A0AAN7BFQ1_9PEZI|nr:hypothetical protein QBC38DRAFT_490148 [Podospora fimiseda]
MASSNPKIRKATLSDLPSILSIILTENKTYPIWDYVFFSFQSSEDKENDSSSSSDDDDDDSLKIMLEQQISHSIDQQSLFVSTNIFDGQSGGVAGKAEKIIACCVVQKEDEKEEQEQKSPAEKVLSWFSSQEKPKESSLSYIKDSKVMMVKLNSVTRQIDEGLNKHSLRETTEIKLVGSSILLSEKERKEAVSGLLGHVVSEKKKKFVIKKFVSRQKGESLDSEVLLRNGFRHVDNIEVWGRREEDKDNDGGWMSGLLVGRKEIVGCVEIWTREPDSVL